MFDENPQSDGPQLDPLDEHIIEMLAEEQWTTGAIIDYANQRVYNRDLELDGIDPDDYDQDDDGAADPVSRQMIYNGLNAFRRLGAIAYAHEPTSLYRLVFDPRTVKDNASADADEHEH